MSYPTEVTVFASSLTEKRGSDITENKDEPVVSFATSMMEAFDDLPHCHLPWASYFSMLCWSWFPGNGHRCGHLWLMY